MISGYCYVFLCQNLFRFGNKRCCCVLVHLRRAFAAWSWHWKRVITLTSAWKRVLLYWESWPCPVKRKRKTEQKKRWIIDTKIERKKRGRVSFVNAFGPILNCFAFYQFIKLRFEWTFWEAIEAPSDYKKNYILEF